MMYVSRAKHSDMCVLRLSTEILDLPNVVITDKNASSDYVRFYDSPRVLVNINLKFFFSFSQKNFWKKSNIFMKSKSDGSKMVLAVMPRRS